MTLPNERYRAIQQARDFLRSLLDPQKTPKVPKSIRIGAYWCLRHFPYEFEMEEIADKTNLLENTFKGDNYEKRK